MFSTFKIVSLWFSYICISAPPTPHSVFNFTNILILTENITNSCFCLNTLYHNTTTLHPHSLPHVKTFSILKIWRIHFVTERICLCLFHLFVVAPVFSVQSSNSIQIGSSLFNFRNVIYLVTTPRYDVASVQTLCHCSPMLFTQWIVNCSMHST